MPRVGFIGAKMLEVLLLIGLLVVFGEFHLLCLRYFWLNTLMVFNVYIDCMFGS